MSHFRSKLVAQHSPVHVGVYYRHETDVELDRVERMSIEEISINDSHLLESPPIPIAGITNKAFSNLIRKIADDLALEIYAEYNATPNIVLVNVIMPNVITVACSYTPDSFDMDAELEKLSL